MCGWPTWILSQLKGAPLSLPDSNLPPLINYLLAVTSRSCPCPTARKPHQIRLLTSPHHLCRFRDPPSKTTTTTTMGAYLFQECAVTSTNVQPSSPQISTFNPESYCSRIRGPPPSEPSSSSPIPLGTMSGLNHMLNLTCMVVPLKVCALSASSSPHKPTAGLSSGC